MAAPSLARAVKAKGNAIFWDPSVTFHWRCVRSGPGPSQFSPQRQKCFTTTWRVKEACVTLPGLRVR